jgi:lipopolysaccharide export system protein LptA
MRRPLIRTCLLAATLVAAAAVLPAPGASQTVSPVSSGLEMNGYQIITDQTNWNLNTGDFTMPKEVKVTRPGSDARGDHAKGNTKLGTATLIGSVVIHDDGGAPEAKDAGSEYNKNGPSTITCDTLTLDSKNKAYDAQGNVHFTQGNRTATAARGVLNQVAHTLHLEGNVVLTEGGSSMKADVVDYNLQSKDVVASGAPMIIKQPIGGGPPPPPPAGSPKAKSAK